MGCDISSLFNLAHRHRHFDRRLIAVVLGQDERLVRNYATPESKRLYRMHRSVLSCLHLKKGFMRFTLSEHGILYAKTRIEHDVIDLLLSHFHGRYPGFLIAIEESGRTHVIGADGKMIACNRAVDDVVADLESEIPEDQSLQGLEHESIWEAFYGSQYIRQRRNLKLMQRMMPLKHRDIGCIENAAAKESSRLSDF